MLLYHNPESSALFFIYSSAIYIDLKLVLAYTVESCRHSHPYVKPMTKKFITFFENFRAAL